MHPRTEYDEEPVCYCRSCLSLHIVVDEMWPGDGWDGSFCADCGCPDIGTCQIGEWEAEEAKRRRLDGEMEWRR